MFDSKTFAILKKIDVQGNPDGYLNDAYNHHFYILSHSARISPFWTTRMARSWDHRHRRRAGAGCHDGQGKIYVDIEDKAAIAVIDATP